MGFSPVDYERSDLQELEDVLSSPIALCAVEESIATRMRSSDCQENSNAVHYVIHLTLHELLCSKT